MASKRCQRCGKESKDLVGHLVKVPRMTADIKMLCPSCKKKAEKKKG